MQCSRHRIGGGLPGTFLCTRQQSHKFSVGNLAAGCLCKERTVSGFVRKCVARFVVGLVVHRWYTSLPYVALCSSSSSCVVDMCLQCGCAVRQETALALKTWNDHLSAQTPSQTHTHTCTNVSVTVLVAALLCNTRRVQIWVMWTSLAVLVYSVRGSQPDQSVTNNVSSPWLGSGLGGICDSIHSLQCYGDDLEDIGPVASHDQCCQA